jgi:hypothetical protein
MRWFFVASAIGCIGLAASAHAAVIYSSFARVCCSGATVSGLTSAAGGEFSAAMGFTPSANYELTQIDVSLTWTAGTNSGPLLTLNSDNAGLPGSVLMSWNLNGGLPPFVSSGACCPAIETVTANSPLLLTAGTQYWLVAAAGASDTWDDWVIGGNLGAPVAITEISAGPLVRIFDDQGGFDVLGTPVPEPGLASLVGVGLSLLVVAARRLSKSVPAT